MVKSLPTLLICIVILFMGLVLRLPHVFGPTFGLKAKAIATLNTRTMHGDEAVNTVKFQRLYYPKRGKAGSFKYDPKEYHGPSLYYLTVPFAAMSGAERYQDTEESLYRSVPLFFGLLMIPLSFMLRREIGLLGCVVIAAGGLVSPAMTYYSRYYIHEMLLVSFTFAAIVFGFKWYRAHGGIKHLWAFCTGVSMAMMHATKETCVIAFGAMFGAMVCVKLLSQWDRLHLNDAEDDTEKSRLNKVYGISFLVGGVLTWFVFYSSFFTNYQGLADSFLTYGHYLKKAELNGDGSGHGQPFWFYHDKLWHSEYGKMIWSEKWLLVGAGMGFVLAFLPKTLPRKYRKFSQFVALYSLLITLVYCLISYKTTWSMLSFLHGYILLCGVAVASIAHLTSAFVHQMMMFGSNQIHEDSYEGKKSSWACNVVIAFLVLVFPCYAMWEISEKTISKRLESHPRNPYVLGQPRGDVKKLAKRADALAALLPAGDRLVIYTHLAPTEYSQLPWPLPWYLRKHLAVFTHIPFGDKGRPVPDLYITDYAYARTVKAEVRKNYITEIYGIYPAVEEDEPAVEGEEDRHGIVKVYIRKDLWEMYLKSRE